MTVSQTKPRDVEIMMYLDGELDGAQAAHVAMYLERDEEGAQVAGSLSQITELVRGSVELAADAAEGRLAGLWEGIETAMLAEEASREALSSDEALSIDTVAKQGINLAPVGLHAKKSEEKATAALVAQAGWFGGWQSHMVSSLVAAAVVFFFVRSGGSPSTSESELGAPTLRAQASSQASSRQPQLVPVVLRSQEPEVEQLEVYNGSGVIMTVPGDADDTDAPSAVIWISSDTDVVEEPI